MMKEISRKQVFTVILLIAAIIGIWLFFSREKKISLLSALIGEGCSVQMEERIVRGNSLSGLIENGEVVTVLFGYYECDEIRRDDLVLYSYAGNEVPLIKIIKGIPGDDFKLEQAEPEVWHILVNGKVVRNSEGNPYFISGNRYKMLALYEKDFRGKIPKGVYLLLGNLVSGAVDSTRFGFVSKETILGKAVR